MTRLLLLTALLIVWTGGAWAQATVTNPAEVRAGAYSVEPAHTQILFAVSHMGFTTYYGTLSDVSGELTLDPKDLSHSSVSVSIPISSIATTSPPLTEKLKGGAWFAGGTYPAMTFKSTSVTPAGANAATIAGDLTLHGFTHPVVLHAQFNGAGTDVVTRAYTVGFSATTQISRSQFGVNTYVPLIGDDVTISISAAFVPK